LGWIDRIFGKREEPKEVKMKLKDVEDFLSDRMKKDFKPLRKDAEKEYANLQLAAKELQNDLKTLGQAPYSTINDRMLIRKAVGSRKSFVNKMKNVVKQIQRPIGEDMNSILNFHNETAKILNATNAKTVNEYTFLKELFKKEANKVIDDFRQIVEIDKRLGNIVNEFADSNVQLVRTQEVASDILRLKGELEKDRVEELENVLKETKNGIEKIEGQLKKLLGGKEWKSFLDIQRSKEELETELRNKKSEFAQTIAKIEKPLRKYKWSVKNKTLDDYVDHSFESVLSRDPRGEAFVDAITDMKIQIIKGELKLKDSGKFLSVINEMIENNTIGNILAEYFKLLEELKRRDEKLELQKAPKKKAGLENQVDRLKRRFEETKAELEKTKEWRREMQSEKDEKIEELQDLLNEVAGKRVLLEVN
jgi:DNA repair exonuclease SbcCD ATPase subunit